jgi:hypothetical protein
MYKYTSELRADELGISPIYVYFFKYYINIAKVLILFLGVKFYTFGSQNEDVFDRIQDNCKFFNVELKVKQD